MKNLTVQIWEVRVENYDRGLQQWMEILTEWYVSRSTLLAEMKALRHVRRMFGSKTYRTASVKLVGTVVP